MHGNNIAKTINSQVLIYNIAPLAFIFGGFFFAVGAILKGPMLGVVASVVGFLAGQYLAKNLHNGRVQKQIFWFTPVVNWFWQEKIPPSYAQFEL